MADVRTEFETGGGVRVTRTAGSFDPDRLPAAVWWASWDGIDGRIDQQEQVDLDAQHSAHRFLQSLENAVVGFHWEW